MTRRFNFRGIADTERGYTERMERRLLVVLAVIAVAVVAVGLSAAATMSRDESVQPTRDVQRMKPRPAKKTTARAPARNNDAPVVAKSGNPQSGDEVKSYWTEERMADAQPMEKTRPKGSTGPSAPAPTGVTVPGSAPTKSTTARTSGKKATKSTKSSQSSAEPGVVTSTATTTDPNYWTDDAMADAQPMDNTRPGGTGSQDDPDLGGTTLPGSPPA